MPFITGKQFRGKLAAVNPWDSQRKSTYTRGQPARIVPVAVSFPIFRSLIRLGTSCSVTWAFRVQYRFKQLGHAGILVFS